MLDVLDMMRCFVVAIVAKGIHSSLLTRLPLASELLSNWIPQNDKRVFKMNPIVIAQTWVLEPKCHDCGVCNMTCLVYVSHTLGVIQTVGPPSG